MDTLTIEKFYVIESETQYKRYCDILEELLFRKNTKTIEDKKNIKLLSLLIETWQDVKTSLKAQDLNPVEFLSVLMKENNVKQKDLAEKLEVSKTLISDIMHYRRGMSKDIIRGLAILFKVSQDAFNKPYHLSAS
jgi:HTH-type transcriptional regulator/antitoxin HigA